MGRKRIHDPTELGRLDRIVVLPSHILPKTQSRCLSTMNVSVKSLMQCLCYLFLKEKILLSQKT